MSDKQPSPEADQASHPPPVAAIGASAGGLEALKGFFEAMPADSGAAFVVVQHLDPTHSSEMTSILSRYTDMAVAAMGRWASRRSRHGARQ